jgi:hypothetical protein
VLENHLESHFRYLKHSTCKLQTSQVRKHLIPEFGEVEARDLKSEHVKSFVDRMTRKYSVSYAIGCVNVIRKAVVELRETHPEVTDPKTWKPNTLRRQLEANAQRERGVKETSCLLTRGPDRCWAAVALARASKPSLLRRRAARIGMLLGRGSGPTK